jgi:hypothetical protein
VNAVNMMHMVNIHNSLPPEIPPGGQGLEPPRGRNFRG